MTTRWNPNDPNVLGLEHLSLSNLAQFVDSAGAMLAERWNATDGYVINKTIPFLDYGSSAPAIPDSVPAYPQGLKRAMVCEIVSRASEAAAPGVTVHTYSPYRVYSVSGDWMDSFTGVPLAGTSSMATLGDGNFVQSQQNGASFAVSFDTSTFPTGRHIIGVGLVLQPLALYGTAGRQWRKTLGNHVGGWHMTPIGASITDIWPEIVADFQVGGAAPWTWWTTAMIQQFVATTAPYRRFVIENRTADGTPFLIDQLQMLVYSIPERRLGVGVFSPDISNNWKNIDMLVPDKSLYPTPTITADYTTFFRRAAPSSFDNVTDATMALRCIDGDPPFAGLTLNGVDLSFNNQPYHVWNDPIHVMPAIRYRNDAVPSDTAYSQPYSLGYGLTVCSGGLSASQDIKASASGNYGVVFFDASTDFGPDGDLTVSIIHSGDNVVMATGRISAEEVEAFPVVSTSAGGSVIDLDGMPLKSYRRVVLALDTAAVLVAGQQYFVSFTAATTSPETPWLLGALITNGGAVPEQTSFGLGPALYGGGGLEANGWLYAVSLINVGNETFTEGDMLVTAGLQPAAPAGFAGEVAIQHTSGGASDAGGCELTSGGGASLFHDDFADTFDGSPGAANHCFVERIYVAALTWTPTALGAAFSYYEVQRHDAYTDWQTIALLTTEATGLFYDYEARVGVISDYRVRVVRADAVPSAWTAVVHLSILSERAELLFVTNEKPASNVGYPDYYTDKPERGFTFPEADEIVTRTVYGRDLQVAFRPTERRGAKFTRQLLVDKRVTRTPPTLDVFAPLRDIAWDPTLAYVCVKDTEGNRWYASLAVPEAAIAAHLAFDVYSASVGVVEISAKSSTPSVSTPSA